MDICYKCGKKVKNKNYFTIVNSNEVICKNCIENVGAITSCMNDEDEEDYFFNMER